MGFSNWIFRAFYSCPPNPTTDSSLRGQFQSIYRSYNFFFLLLLLFRSYFVFHRTKSKAIYRLLDWSKPGKAIVVCIACICSVFIVHILVYCLYRCRVCIFKKFCLRERNFHQYVANDDQVIYENNQTMKSRTPSSHEEHSHSKPAHVCRGAPVIEYRAWANKPEPGSTVNRNQI